MPTTSLLSILIASLLAIAPGAQPPAPPQPTAPQPTVPPTAPLPGDAQGTKAREQMWYAPTAEDWAKPVLIPFQRTWDDAVALAKETGKAILVCINMDGEIASEHYAGVRYRQPEVAKLYEPYVCVIASVYRHTPRDYDEQGRRVPCPRFGCVTCGEHIAIEPVLFAKFMEGRRIAPRHIMVELDGSETYDVFYAFDTTSVFKAIHDGIANRQAPPPIVRGDRSLAERVASPDQADKLATEKAFLEGDAQARKALLQAALARGGSAPIDLLRLGVFALDGELGKAARQALAQSQQEGAVDVITEALRVPMDAGEREALVGALARLGDKSPRARTLAVVHQGLGQRSAAVDTERWAQALVAAGGYQPADDVAALESRADRASAEAAKKPSDPQAQLDHAEATLVIAVDPKASAPLRADRRMASKYTRMMLEDAKQSASNAEQLGAKGWRVNAVIGLANYYLGDTANAYARAEAGVQELPPDAQGWLSMSALALFAEARQKAITDAVVEKREWPGQWLTDVHAAYSVIGKHALGTAGHVVSHYDFVKWLGGLAQAARILDAGLQRFPESPELHDRLRGRLLEEGGAEGLQAAYVRLLEAKDATPATRWFAGYAAVVAAEYFRRANQFDQAVAAYGRGIELFEASVQANPQSADSSAHQIAMALGGRARVALERKQLDAALADVIASFERRPDSANVLDGLNLSTVDTAKMLRTHLVSGKLEQPLAQLDAAMAKLDPRLLELPAYERETPPPGAQGRGRGRGRRGG